jgi:hypothetical protein
VVSAGSSREDRDRVVSKADRGLAALADFSKAERDRAVLPAAHHRLLLHSNGQAARTNLPRGKDVGQEATEEPEAGNQAVNNLVNSSVCLVIVT